jgi:aminopeptidase YwaD
MKHSFLALLILITFVHAGAIAQPNVKSELAQMLQHHVEVLASDSMEGRGLGTEGKLRAQKYIAEQFAVMGLKPIGEDYFQQLDLHVGLAMVKGANVVGYLEGSDPKLQDEYILIGAHYDHLGYKYKDDKKVIYHGGDDNASGVATMIELARYFAANPQIVKRSIIFVAFDGEESGLLGSEKFIKENKVFGINNIGLMFSFDMVGMYTENKGLILKGMGTLKGGDILAREVASAQDIELKNTSTDIEARTDTWPFAVKGIPAVHAFTGSKSPYHKPEDTWNLLDYEGMARITTYFQELITATSAMPDLAPLPRFVRAQKPGTIKLNIGLTASAGTSRHLYPDEYYDAKRVFAYGGGAFIQMQMGKRITLQPEILYRSDGSKIADGSFRRQTLTVPLNVHFNLVDEPAAQAKIYVLGGGYFMYSFNGKNGGEDLDFDHLYEDQEWGYDLGLGMDVMGFQVTYTWQRSLTNLAKTDGSKIIPTGWYISAGYKF